jgi:transposase-like protein
VEISDAIAFLRNSRARHGVGGVMCWLAIPLGFAAVTRAIPCWLNRIVKLQNKNIETSFESIKRMQKVAAFQNRDFARESTC